MPGRMVDFVAYWRSRGYTMRQAYRLWRYVGYSMAATGRAKITDGTLRWACQ